MKIIKISTELEMTIHDFPERNHERTKQSSLRTDW